MRKGEKAKQTIIQRIRKRVHCTIDPENYEYLKKIGINASGLMDAAISELRTKTKAELVLICENNEKYKPQTGVEPVASSLPRTRYATKPLRRLCDNKVGSRGI